MDGWMLRAAPNGVNSVYAKGVLRFAILRNPLSLSSVIIRKRSSIQGHDSCPRGSRLAGSAEPCSPARDLSRAALCETEINESLDT